ncbi:GNAT family N-acetyltransferase [Candidatus Peregrinibacteria bacterium]|nr:GNAT family N-acetyltransferase [Candidatus Peregrinibacteria bacterium]
MLKDAGFKVNCHIMPGLPGSSAARDIKMFKELFSNPNFQPDWLKIYPCVVVPGSALENIWRNKKFKPYTDKQMISLLAKIKPIIPEYVRVTRLYRDIPSNSILAGPKISNLREYVQREMHKNGLKCRCIRCREIKDFIVDPKNLELHIQRYEASDGLEYFLSFDDIKQNKICSLLRLRFPSNFFKKAGCAKHFLPELNNCAIIRELHTYGLQIPVSERGELAVQHLGLGRKLLTEAESLSRDAGFSHIAVISGVGARDYYKKFGYQLKSTYMIKKLVLGF